MKSTVRKIPFVKKLVIYSQRILGSVSIYLFIISAFFITFSLPNSDIKYIFRNDGEWIITKAAFFKTQKVAAQTANNNTNTDFICNFQFESKNGLIQKTIPIKDYEAPRLKIIGDSLYIQYKELNPQRAYPYNFAHKWSDIFMATLFFVLGLIIFFLNLFVQRKFVWFLKHGTCVIAQNVELKPLFLDTQKISLYSKYEFKADFVVNGQTYHTNTVTLKLLSLGKDIILNDLKNIQILYNPENPSDNFPLAYSTANLKFKISDTNKLESNFWVDFFLSSANTILILLITIIYILARFVIATFF